VDRRSRTGLHVSSAVIEGGGSSSPTRSRRCCPSYLQAACHRVCNVPETLVETGSAGRARHRHLRPAGAKRSETGRASHVVYLSTRRLRRRDRHCRL